MRRALVSQLPALTHFYNGAIHPLNVDEYTTRELSEYVTQMQQYHEAERKAAERNG